MKVKCVMDVCIDADDLDVLDEIKDFADKHEKDIEITIKLAEVELPVECNNEDEV